MEVDGWSMGVALCIRVLLALRGCGAVGTSEHATAGLLF